MELFQVVVLGVLCELVLQARLNRIRVHVRRGGCGGTSRSQGRR